MNYPSHFVAVSCADPLWVQVSSPSGAPKGIEYATLLPGGGGTPQVHLNRYEPGWTEARHRHVEDEVLILVAGELDVEGQVHQAPAMLFIGRHTLYGPLTAGSEGATFYRIGHNEKLMARSKEVQQTVGV